MALKTLLQFRRDTAANWTSANPTLSAGEPGFETNTGKVKIGDGSTAWNTLAYINPGAVTVASDTIWDAKGDLAVGTGADTAAKLAVGSNGQVLTADSTQTTGTKWTAAGGGAKLYDYEVTGSDKASIDTNVDGTTVANFSGYDLLEVFLYHRLDEAVNTAGIDMFFNNDTGTNYEIERLRGSSGSALVTESTSRAGLQFLGAGANDTASVFSVTKLAIPNYLGTVGFKTCLIEGGTPDVTNSNKNVEAYSVLWKSTAAITRIKVAPTTAAKKFKIGSRLMVYGR